VQYAWKQDTYMANHVIRATLTTQPHSPRRSTWFTKRLIAVAVASLALASLTGTASAHPSTPVTNPDLGPNTLVFDPSMPTSQIQAAVDAVAAQQVGNQFGDARYALLFKPGTYGSATEPLNFQVGYYTEVAGLGQSPTDVTINGSIYVRNQCDNGTCFALNNFWRSLSNLTINVTTPNFGCYSGQFWAVSQAAPMRRVNVTGGNVTLMDYCTGPSFASGGFIADSQFAGGTVINGSQQQFFVRDTNLDGWTNGVWNQVFSGVNGAPATCFPGASACGGPYTTVAATPVSREKPYLFVDSSGAWNVFVPAARTNSVGTTWENGPTPGRTIPLSDFFVARPSDSARTINKQLDKGRNLLFTPGVYNVDKTIEIERRGTVVLGLGLATLTAVDGAVTMKVENAPGADIAGLTFDAGSKNSPVLLQIDGSDDRGGHGYSHSSAKSTEPTALQDVFFRIGGPHIGKATVSLKVNADNVVLDDIWAWRADHGTGVGWTSNTADTGVIVNGDNVTATGLFVEHYQKTEVRWNGENGKTIFFQNELPYDVPSQSAWMDGTMKGYAAYKVGSKVKTHEAWGLGSYSFFNQGVDIFADNAFVVPQTAGVKMHNMLTIFLDASTGKGGILNVINGVGGPSTIANPDVPVTVVDYP
jgi:hypothetical protein